MSILPLVQISTEDLSNKENPLKKPCNDVDDFGSDFQKIVDDLIETFWSHRIAVGLAAPQIGIQLRVAVINQKNNEGEPDLLIVNPKIISNTGKKDRRMESCMSLPHYAGEVERRHKISISYQDRFGEIRKLEASGFLARIILHEIDHLEGFLYVDRMSSLSRLESTDIFNKD